MSIFPPNMPGRRLRLTGICTLTVCGYPDSLRTWLPTLADECIRDSKEKGKKDLLSYLQRKWDIFSDPEYLKYKGFETADAAGPYFELMYLAFDKMPTNHVSGIRLKTVRVCQGPVLYYTGQCPFTAKYVPLLETAAKERDVELQTVHIRTKDDAQNAPSPLQHFHCFDGEPNL